MEFLVLNGLPWNTWKEKSSVEFNCRLICKQRVPGRVLPGSPYRVKNWSRLRPVARSSGSTRRRIFDGRTIERRGRYVSRCRTSYGVVSRVTALFGEPNLGV